MEPTVIKFDSLESTSDLLKQHAESFPDFTVISAGYQTKGRGQFDHVWESNKNENLLFSILFKDHVKVLENQIKKITLDVLFTFFKQHDINVNFKEPNDIFVGPNKICGILIETRYEKHLLDYIIVGIGVNVNQNQFSGFPATSLNILNKKTYKLDRLFDQVVSLFKKAVSIAIKP